MGASFRLAPLGQKSPASHSLHAIAPVSFWYEPDEHMVHCADEAVGAWLPGLQAVGETTPVPHALPAGHDVHSAALLRLSALEKLPDGHGNAAAAPSLQ